MTLKELFDLEVEGITETINEYATSHFIISYSKQLQQLRLPEDREKIIVIVNRLISWYKDKIEDIRNSAFIVNKEQHDLSLNLLRELEHRLSVKSAV